MMTTRTALNAQPLHDYVRGPAPADPSEQIKAHYEEQIRLITQKHAEELAAQKEKFIQDTLALALDKFSKDELTAAELKGIKKFLA